MKTCKLWTLIQLFVLSAAMILTLQVALRASPGPEPTALETATPRPPRGIRAPQTDFTTGSSDGAASTGEAVGPHSASDAGGVLEVFTNTWSYSTLGLVFDPVRNHVRYAHESQSDSSNPTIYDVDPVAHTVIQSIALSVKNPGWPWSLDNRTGVGHDFNTDTYFLPDYNGDLSNADDNIVEITPDGVILNAWEMDDEVGGNDSSDGSAIHSVIDIAVVPGDPTRYFVTAAYDGSIVYEIALTKTGTWWTPNSWSTLMTYTVPGLTDNLGIDYDAEHEQLYHSGWQTTTIVVTDLSCTPVETFTCPSEAGYHSGITYIEGSDPPEVWVTNFTDDRTTRCEAPGVGPTGIEWGKWVDGQPWTPDLVVTTETSDTLKVLDVFTTTQAVSLVEQWDPANLTLLDWATSPDAGALVTGSNSLRWDMPPFPTVMTMTKWFHVEPSTWMTTTLAETLLLDDQVHEERPVTIEKEPPMLTLQTHHPDGVLPGSVATYTLVYANEGGYENGVSVLSTLPVTAPIVHADPLPDSVAADGTLAVWNVGDLANSSVGEIDVAVVITSTAIPSQSVGIGNAVRNHVEEVADEANFAYHVQEPPEIEYTWEKFVDGQLQPPGAVATVETSQTIQVVDVVSAANVLLVEAWNADRLTLIEVASSAGEVVTAPNGVEWHVATGTPMPVALTKTFQVEPCTWTETELWEELLVDPGTGPVPVQEWPIWFEKRPSSLWIEGELRSEPEVQPGEMPSFVLHYGNAGGLESGAWISVTVPDGVSFAGADPLPDDVGPEERWAVWALPALPEGAQGAVTVTVEILPGVTPSSTVMVSSAIYDHADIERARTEILYHVEPPTWEKAVNGVAWHDGMSLTVQTGDEFEVVDVVDGPFNTTLVEHWNPKRLELIGVELTAGAVVTSEGSLEWMLPWDSPAERILEKRFRVKACAWTHSLLHEELWVEGMPWQERPVAVFKPPAKLWIDAVPQEGEPPIKAFAGEGITFRVDYGNWGGYESRAWITATFPAEMPFVGADPAPTGYHPDGRWAWWDLGDLPQDESGCLSVSAELSPELSSYETLHAYTYIYDHIDVERAWSPITVTVKPLEPAWEKEIWVNGSDLFGPEDGPYGVAPEDEVTVIDRVYIAAATPVSLTLTEEWADALSLSEGQASVGAVDESAGTLIWHGTALHPNTWHVLTKTFVIDGADWETAAITEALTVAHADPPTRHRMLRFVRSLQVFLPLVIRE